MCTVGAEADSARIEFLLNELEGKDILEVIAAGKEKFASVPSGGGGGVAVVSSGGGGAAAPAAVEEKVEEKKEEPKEESDDVSVFFSGVVLFLLWLEIQSLLSPETVCERYLVLHVGVNEFYSLGHLCSEWPICASKIWDSVN